MSIFTSFFGWLGGNANTQRTGSQITSPSTSAHEDAPLVGVDGALQVSTVWACVTLLTETISSLPLTVFKTNKNDERETLKDHLLYTVLHSTPNSRQTSQEFWEQMLMNYFLRGNCYAEIKRAKNGQVISL